MYFNQRINHDYYQFNQHQATPGQVAQGVIDLQGDDLAQQKLLNFVGMPTNGDIHDRTFDIARLADQSGAEGCNDRRRTLSHAALAKEHCKPRGIAVLYAFSGRVSVGRVVDGVVVKPTCLNTLVLLK